MRFEARSGGITAYKVHFMPYQGSVDPSILHHLELCNDVTYWIASDLCISGLFMLWPGCIGHSLNFKRCCLISYQ